MNAPIIPTTAMIAAWLGRPEAVVEAMPEVIDGFRSSYLRMMKAAPDASSAAGEAPDVYAEGRSAGMALAAQIVRDDIQCRWFRTDGNTERQAAAHAIEAVASSYATYQPQPTGTRSTGSTSAPHPVGTNK